MTSNLTQHRDLLVEIGTEELPPRALQKLMNAFSNGIAAGLAQAGLEHGAMHPYATPRRLAVHITALAASQPDRPVERRGPALSAAFDDKGLPTKATQGFARSCGIDVEQLEKLETDDVHGSTSVAGGRRPGATKGSWLVFRSTQVGRATAELLPAIIEQSLATLPISKRMRWGSSRVEFVRPVHWVVLLFGNDIVDAEILGVHAGCETRGHRFHHPAAMYLATPAAYAPLLETEGRVMPDFAMRREAIRAQVIEAAVSFGGTAVIDDVLLDEVTGLVEWPVALTGQFEKRFLDVPQEALIFTMKGNQKYFHAVDKNGKLMPYFITISNIESRDPDKVREGNERVIRPRFSDAAFFWEQDCKHPLENYLEKLKSVVFEAKLGTLHDKTQRVAALANAITNDGHTAHRAATLAKCDLLTNMVNEFPELQGIMGHYYALHDGESAEVAKAIEEHYLPRHAGDVLPMTAAGQAVAIADKLDTLTGIFTIGQAPSGDKDPYALRRAALGVLRIIIECKLDLDLQQLLITAATGMPGTLKQDNTASQVFDFMMERLRGYYHEQGIRSDVFEAVLANRPTRPFDFNQRIHAVTAFRALPEAESLAAANKRIRNILNKTSDTIPNTVNETLLAENAEKTLFKQVTLCSHQVTPLLKVADYTQAMIHLASLREPVDTFFEKVMVMADDPVLRANRLALLKKLGDLMNHVADISRLAV